MNTVQNQANAAATIAADTPTNVTPDTTGTPPAGGSPVDILTARLLALVVEMEGVVPELKAHDPLQLQRVNTTARFAENLIVPTITTVTTVPTPPGLFDVDKGREALEYRDKVGPVLQRLAVLLSAATFTLNDKMAGSGEEVLQTYRWAKAAVKNGRRPDLQPYVDEMTRVVKKVLNARKVKAAAPAPGGTPTTPPASGDTTPPSGAQTFLALHRPVEPQPVDPEQELYDRWAEAIAA
jgi:hypothetical protein